jgi:hypothetical protein
MVNNCAMQPYMEAMDNTITQKIEKGSSKNSSDGSI